MRIMAASGVDIGAYEDQDFVPPSNPDPTPSPSPAPSSDVAPVKYFGEQEVVPKVFCTDWDEILVVDYEGTTIKVPIEKCNDGPESSSRGSDRRLWKYWEIFPESQAKPIEEVSKEPLFRFLGFRFW
jgi:hypothetical protein